MEVEAIKVGFYGKLRKVGEVFTISGRGMLGSWMKEVKETKRKKEA